MKKTALVSIILVLALLLAFTGCSKKPTDNTDPSQNPGSEATSPTPHINDEAKDIDAESPADWAAGIKVENITKAQAWSHVTAKDLSAEEIAELVKLINGIEANKFTQADEKDTKTAEFGVEITCGEDVYVISQAKSGLKMNFKGAEWLIDNGKLESFIKDQSSWVKFGDADSSATDIG